MKYITQESVLKKQLRAPGARPTEHQPDSLSILPVCCMNEARKEPDMYGKTQREDISAEEISIRYTDAGSMEAQKGKVYRTAGVAGGILCAVLIV